MSRYVIFFGWLFFNISLANAGHSRYDITDNSQNLYESKNVLSGYNKSGEKIEIPPEDVNNKLIFAKKIKDKYYRYGSGELSDLFDFSNVQGGAFVFPIETSITAQKALLSPHHFMLNEYPSNEIIDGYIDDISSFFKNTIGIKWCSSDNIIIGAGATEIMNSDLSVISHKDRKNIIIVQKDEYHNFARIGEKWGVNAVFIDKIDKYNLNNWWNNNPFDREYVVGILMTNPVSPSGYIYKKNEIEDIANFAKKNNIIVVSDQIYQTSIFDSKNKLYSIANVNGMEKLSITTWSPSKSLGVVHARQGFGCVPNHLANDFFTYAALTSIMPNKIAQVMGQESLKLINSEYHVFFTETLKNRANILVTKINEYNNNIKKYLKTKKPQYYNDKDIISIKKRIEAGYNGMIDFEIFEQIPMVNRAGEVIKNSLDLAGLFLEYGVPLSPLYSTHNEKMQFKCSFAQFGEKATRMVNLRKIIQNQFNMISEYGYNLTEKLNLTPEVIKKICVANGYPCDFDYLDIDTYDKAVKIGDEKYIEALDKIYTAMLDIIDNQEKWQKRNIINDSDLIKLSNKIDDILDIVISNKDLKPNDITNRYLYEFSNILIKPELVVGRNISLVEQDQIVSYYSNKIIDKKYLSFYKNLIKSYPFLETKIPTTLDLIRSISVVSEIEYDKYHINDKTDNTYNWANERVSAEYKTYNDIFKISDGDLIVYSGSLYAPITPVNMLLAAKKENKNIKIIIIDNNIESFDLSKKYILDLEDKNIINNGDIELVYQKDYKPLLLAKKPKLGIVAANNLNKELAVHDLLQSGAENISVLNVIGLSNLMYYNISYNINFGFKNKYIMLSKAYHNVDKFKDYTIIHTDGEFWVSPVIFSNN